MNVGMGDLKFEVSGFSYQRLAVSDKPDG